MAKLVPPEKVDDKSRSMFEDRARILSNSSYMELEYMANEKLHENLQLARNNTDNWIKAYFWILGFNSTIFVSLIHTTLHYFKSKYRDYTFSFLSLAALKLPIFVTIFIVIGLRRVTFSIQLILSAIGMLVSFIGTYNCAKNMPDSVSGLLLTIGLQALGAVFQYIFQATAIRIAAFYDPKCISFYYASASLSSILTSCVALVAVYYKASKDTFMFLFCLYGAISVFLCMVAHSVLMSSEYYQKRINDEYNPEDGSLKQVYESFKKVTGDLKTLLVTVMLTAITFKSVFYEICPSFIEDSLWNNSVNIGTQIAEFFGKYLGYDFKFKPVIDYFYWFPWVYNIIINGVYIWGDTNIYDSYWIVFSVLLIFLCFRHGLAITFFVSKAIIQTKDPNCGMIMNYGKEAGLAFGSVICLGVGYLKHLFKYVG